MKIQNRDRHSEEGNVLMVCLVTTAIIGFTLASFLMLVRAQNRSTMRSLTWNAAIPVAEAGLEEALTHLNRVGSAGLGVSGWELVDGKYSVTRFLGDSYYVVSVTPTASPVIVSTGYVPLPLNGTASGVFAVVDPFQQAPIPVDPSLQPTLPPTTVRYVSRTIRLQTRLDAMFSKAMVAKGQIDLRGNNIQTDSFDSANALYSTGGLYDSTKRKANGDVATNSGVINSLNVGNANVYGRVSTGPGGSVAIGSNGAVGGLAWQQSGSSGIQPGYCTDDMNVSFPDVQPPFNAAIPPASGTVNGTNYSYVMGDGEYQLASFDSKQSICVTGHATLLVTDSFSLSGNSGVLRIAPGASLKLYVGAASASLSGQGVVNETGRAESFMYMGLPANTSLEFSGNTAFTGVIYAPDADFTLGGGGSTTIDFIGASVTKSVTMNGHFNFHYDEDLARIGPSRGYIVTSWDEI